MSQRKKAAPRRKKAVDVRHLLDKFAKTEEGSDEREIVVASLEKSASRMDLDTIRLFIRTIEDLTGEWTSIDIRMLAQCFRWIQFYIDHSPEELKSEKQKLYVLLRDSVLPSVNSREQAAALAVVFQVTSFPSSEEMSPNVDDILSTNFPSMNSSQKKTFWCGCVKLLRIFRDEYTQLSDVRSGHEQSVECEIRDLLSSAFTWLFQIRPSLHDLFIADWELENAALRANDSPLLYQIAMKEISEPIFENLKLLRHPKLVDMLNHIASETDDRTTYERLVSWFARLENAACREVLTFLVDHGLASSYVKYREVIRRQLRVSIHGFESPSRILTEQFTIAVVRRLNTGKVEVLPGYYASQAKDSPEWGKQELAERKRRPAGCFSLQDGENTDF